MNKTDLHRLLAGLGLLVVVGIGVRSGTNFAGATEAQVQAVMEKKISAEQQESNVLKRGKRFENTAEHFVFELAEDSKKYSLAELTAEELARPNPWRILVEGSEPVNLAPGKKFSGDGIGVKARSSKVRYTKGGVSVKSVHAVAVLENNGSVPLAYRIVVEPSKSGSCEVRGMRRHNALALMPGEKAEVVVCAGRGGISIRALEVMELTPLGYYYVSMLPPSTFGIDATRSSAHAPPRGAALCTGVPARKIASALRTGDVQWRDVVDFYSRHSCHRLQVPKGYAWTDTPREQLPVLGPPMAR